MRSDSDRCSEQILRSRIDKLLQEYCFDIQGVPVTKFSAMIDEATLARLLTKLAVGSATVWWSLLEIKDMVSLYRRSRKNTST